MTIYNVQVNKDNPDDNDPLNSFTVNYQTYDDSQNLIQNNGPGINAPGQVTYLQNLLLRTDLTQDEIDMTNAQITALQQFLINNPIYNPNSTLSNQTTLNTNYKSSPNPVQAKSTTTTSTSIMQKIKNVIFS